MIRGEVQGGYTWLAGLWLASIGFASRLALPLSRSEVLFGPLVAAPAAAIAYLLAPASFFYGLFLFMAPIDRYYIDGPYMLKIYQVSLVLAGGKFLWVAATRGAPLSILQRLANPMTIAFTFYLGWCWLSLTYTIAPSVTIRVCLLRTIFLFCILAVLWHDRDISTARRSLRILLWSAVLYCLYGIIEFALGFAGLVSLAHAGFAEAGLSNIIFGRPSSVFWEPDNLGLYTMLLILFLFPQFDLRHGFSLVNCTFFLALAANVLALVRTSWVSMLAVAVLALMTFPEVGRLRGRMWKNAKTLSFTLALIVLALLLIHPDLLASTLDRFQSSFYINDAASLSRLEVPRQQLIKVIELGSFLGYGVGAWEEIGDYLYTVVGLHLNYGATASMFTNTLFESGPIGLILYSFVFLYLMHFFWKRSREPGAGARIAYGGFLSLAGLLIGCQFSDMSTYGFFWIYLATIYSFVRLCDEREEKGSVPSL